MRFTEYDRDFGDPTLGGVPMHSVYYNNLKNNKKIYDAALRCFQNREKSFSVEASFPVNELAVEVLNDHPEIFYVGQEFRVMTGIFQREIMPVYLYSPIEVLNIRDKLNDTVKRIIGGNINRHQSDYDKVCSLHDYFKSNLKYDTVAASVHRPNDRTVAEAHSIVGALLENKCVCEGFAKAFKLLCDNIGLECWVVSGMGRNSICSGPHAWNIVKINGYYHHVDVTWDNQYADPSGFLNYGYMNLSDDEISSDHTWNRNNYPACPSSPYNYFRVNNALLDSRVQLENMLYNCFRAEDEFIMFRVVRRSALEREINVCLTDSIRRASERCKHISVSAFRCGGVAEQLTFFVQPDYCYG